MPRKPTGFDHLGNPIYGKGGSSEQVLTADEERAKKAGFEVVDYPDEEKPSSTYDPSSTTSSTALIPHPTVGVMPPEYTKATAVPKGILGKVKYYARKYITPGLVLGIANAANKAGYLKGNIEKDILGYANMVSSVQHPDAQKLAGVLGAVPAVAGLYSRGSEVAGGIKQRYFGADGKGRPPSVPVTPSRSPGTTTPALPRVSAPSRRANMAEVRASLGMVGSRPRFI